MKKVKKDSKATKPLKKPKVEQPPAQNSLATDFRAWIGMAAHGPVNPNPKFTTEDQLWEKDVD